MPKTVILYYPLLNKTKEERQFHWFPYSVLPLAQMLKQNGYNPIIIDHRVQDDIFTPLQKYKDDLLFVGISAMSGYQILDGLKIAQEIRKTNPDIPIIWGGWHPTILPEETAEHELVDVAIAGRGENIFIELIESFNGKKELADIKGIAFKKGGESTFTGYSKEYQLIDDAQEYDKFIDINLYINSETMALGYFSGHGCVFKCAFCSRHFMTNKMLTYPVDKVISDIKYFYKKHGFRHIHFHDDTLFIDINRVFTIAQKLIEEKLDISWWANVRANTLYKLTKQEIEFLIKSGMKSLFIGVESASPELLKIMNKGIKPDDILKTNHVMKNYDVTLNLSYMFGLPGDNVEYLKQTIDQIKELKSENPNVKIQTCFYQPYPGTPLYEKSLEWGYSKIHGLENWGNIQPQSELQRIPWLSAKEMDEYLKKFEELKAFL